jgi:hypothetical protein
VLCSPARTDTLTALQHYCNITTDSCCSHLEVRARELSHGVPQPDRLLVPEAVELGEAQPLVQVEVEVDRQWCEGKHADHPLFPCSLTNWALSTGG